MGFAIYKGDKNMTELVSRLFRLQGRGSQTAAKQAADALLKANPSLKDLSSVPVGSIIAIPDTAPPIHPSERVSNAVLARSAVVIRSQASINLIEQQAVTISPRAVDLTKTFLEATKAPELRAASENSPEFKRAMAEMIDTAQAMLKDLQQDTDTRNAEIIDIRSSLAAFIGQ